MTVYNVLYCMKTLSEALLIFANRQYYTGSLRAFHVACLCRQDHVVSCSIESVAQQISGNHVACPCGIGFP